MIKKAVLINLFFVLIVWLLSCNLVSDDKKNAVLIPRNNDKYYKDKVSQLFPFPDENLQNYNVIRGQLDIKSTEKNHFSATFLDDVLKSYELTIYGEMGKSEYHYRIHEGFIFLYYALTEYTEPFITDGAKEYVTRFIADGDELLIYDTLSALINVEQKSIFNTALSFEQKIINGEFQKDDWLDTFADLIQYGDIPGHFQKIILIDVDFDGIPELFLTMSSITNGNRHWIDEGFAYKDGMVVDIKCSLPSNLELYRYNETSELLWIADGVDYNFVSYPIIEHSYDYYWIMADFSDISKIEQSKLFHWREEYTTTWDVENSQSESVFTLVGYFDDDRIISKVEINELKSEVFSRYEHIDAIKIIGDAQKFGLVNWSTDEKYFLRDELLTLLRSYE